MAIIQGARPVKIGAAIRAARQETTGRLAVVLPAGPCRDHRSSRPGRVLGHGPARRLCGLGGRYPALAGRSGFPGLYPVFAREQNGLVRVVATRIEWDGTMQRRMVDTAHASGGLQWEDLAARALAAAPPYCPAPGTPVYHVGVDDGTVVLVAEHDLCGPLLDLVTAVLAMGEAVLARAAGFAGLPQAPLGSHRDAAAASGTPGGDASPASRPCREAVAWRART